MQKKFDLDSDRQILFILISLKSTDETRRSVRRRREKESLRRRDQRAPTTSRRRAPRRRRRRTTTKYGNLTAGAAGALPDFPNFRTVKISPRIAAADGVPNGCAPLRDGRPDSAGGTAENHDEDGGGPAFSALRFAGTRGLRRCPSAKRRQLRILDNLLKSPAAGLGISENNSYL